MADNFTGGYEPKDIGDPNVHPPYSGKPFITHCPINGKPCGEWCALYLRSQRMCAIKSLAITCAEKLR
jgi:hypothetical protein